MNSGMMMNLARNLIKYVLEGLGVALAAFYIPERSLSMQEIGMIALTAAATFFLLDLFAPAVGSAARMGAGFGVGAKQVGFARKMMMMPAMEPFKGGACGAEHDMVNY